jgi:glutamine cyclotransferase
LSEDRQADHFDMNSLQTWVTTSLAVIAAVAAGQQQKAPSAASIATYSVVRAYPHDSTAYTQGLEFRDGALWESVGNYGVSEIRRVRLQDGAVEHARRLDARYFGEGVTVWGDLLIQLTWREQVAFVYDRVTLQPRRTFAYDGEGWGLTNDGTRLIMSDGTDTLRFLDPASFRELGRIRVTERGGPVFKLNELEFIDGKIWANVYEADHVVVIAPETGKVQQTIDLSGLLRPQEAAKADVLNGIAYDKRTGRIFVTGKWWPKLFELKKASN